MILAIDPGNEYSAYVLMREDYSLHKFAKVHNDDLISLIYYHAEYDMFAIETVESYGMPVGREVFETVFWSGRFYEMASNRVEILHRIPRKEVKLNLCGSMRAKDSNIIQALKDRFGDKGTKKNPGFFYGVSADVWQAIALGVTFLDGGYSVK